MYAIYDTKQDAHKGSYRFDKETHFFGIRSGLVPRLVKESVSSDQGEPYKWHLPISSRLGAEGKTFLIDLKPNNRDAAASRSLYELRDVWGYTDAGWTPAMLRLRGLVVDGEPHIEDPRDFSVEFSAENQAIYSFLYLAGGIGSGALTGKWTAPRASPTNSALLWIDAFRYFIKVASDQNPEILEFGTA